MLDRLNHELQGFVTLQVQGAVLQITMIKPKVNAICRQMSRSLARAAMYLQDDPDLRVGILTSASPKSFSAGLDFNEAGQAFEPSGEGGFGGITRLWALKKPLIAAINAPAVGGGVELALACDIILMAEDAWLQLPELERGLLPDGGGIQRLPRRIPYHVATTMIWTGARMGAAEALHWGLASRIAPRADLMAMAMTMAQKIAASAPLAQQALKEVLRAVDAMSEREAMSLRADTSPELATYAKMLRSEDMVEGQRAFLEKRRPQWTGR